MNLMFVFTELTGCRLLYAVCSLSVAFTITHRLQVKTLTCKEIQGPARDHVASKWQARFESLVFLLLEYMLLILRCLSGWVILESAKCVHGHQM